MSLDDQIRWDTQHAQRHEENGPSSFVRQIFEADGWQIRRGRALDIAAGKGRNAFYLAELGFAVEAVDISAVALDAARQTAERKRLHVAWQQLDLEKTGFPQDEYDLIVNVNYLQRSLVPRIKAALRIGGHVIFETYLIDQQILGHPKNPDYLLGHNELLDWFSGYRILYYREGKFADGAELSFRAGILAQKIA